VTVNQQRGRRNARDPMVRGSKLILAGVAFAAIQAVSLIWTTNPHRTLQFSIQAFELFVIFPAVFASLPRSVRIVEKGLILFLGATAVLAVALLFVYATNPTARQAGTYLPGMGRTRPVVTRRSVSSSGTRCSSCGRDSGGYWCSSCCSTQVASSPPLPRGAMLRCRRRHLRGQLDHAPRSGGGGDGYADPGRRVLRRDRTGRGSQDGPRRCVQLRELEAATLGRSAAHHTPAPVPRGRCRAYYRFFATANRPNNTLLRTWAETGNSRLLALMYLLFVYSQMVARWRRHPDRYAAALAAACAGVFMVQFMHSEVDVSWVRGLGSMMFASLGMTIALERLTEHETAPAIDPATTEAVPARAAPGDERLRARIGMSSE